MMRKYEKNIGKNTWKDLNFLTAALWCSRSLASSCLSSASLSPMAIKLSIHHFETIRVALNHPHVVDFCAICSTKWFIFVQTYMVFHKKVGFIISFPSAEHTIGVSPSFAQTLLISIISGWFHHPGLQLLGVPPFEGHPPVIRVSPGERNDPLRRL